MEIGASSSCFYPLETKASFEELGVLGIKATEIFFNADSELSKDYLSELNRIKDYYGMSVGSLHPFTSACTISSSHTPL